MQVHNALLCTESVAVSVQVCFDQRSCSCNPADAAAVIVAVAAGAAALTAVAAAALAAAAAPVAAAAFVAATAVAAAACHHDAYLDAALSMPLSAECGLLLAARPVRAGFLTRVPSRLNELRKVLSYRQEPDASVYSLVMPTGVSKSPLLLLFCTGQRYNLPAGPSRV